MLFCNKINMGKILSKFILLFLIVGLVYFIFDFFQIKTTKADIEPDEVTGWAWFGANCTDINELTRNDMLCDTGTTNPIGWISFNSRNPEITCGNISYGVKVDYTTGEISGAAWIGIGEDSNYNDCTTTENTIGWLYFDADKDASVDDTPSCGNEGYPDGDCFPAKIINNEIQGWAPIISKNDTGSSTIITWVRFKGDKYSVRINSDGKISTNPNEHYAWSGKGNEGGLGWIDFSSSSFSPGVKFPPLSPTNNPPSVNLEHPDVSEIYCGVNPGLGKIYFKWRYTDSDGDMPSQFKIKVKDVSTNNVVLERIINNPSCNDTDPGSGFSCDYIEEVSVGIDLQYGKNYNWLVIGYDSEGAGSGWVNGSDFDTPLHSLPWPDFQVPPTIRVGNVITFTDTSKCYTAGGSEYNCKENSNNRYEWDFNNDGTIECDSASNPACRGDATTTYSSVGSYTVTLKITDNVGFCLFSHSVSVKMQSPDWREVPPVSWFRNFFASIVNFFRDFF